jgi:hypothetical protein
VENLNKEKIGQNRKKLIKLVIIVFLAWMTTLIYYFYILRKFGSIDDFVWLTYVEENSYIYLIFALIVGYIWVLGSFMILVIGVINLIWIRINCIKYEIVDFLIVLFPITLYVIRLLVKFPIFQTGLDLPIY